MASILQRVENVGSDLIKIQRYNFVFENVRCEFTLFRESGILSFFRGNVELFQDMEILLEKYKFYYFFIKKFYYFLIVYGIKEWKRKESKKKNY